MTRRRGAPPGRRGPRGRVLVAVALAGFVLVAAAVVWRRGEGIARARALRTLEARRAQLVAERAALESAVRQAASRGRIGGAVEHQLGMRVPSDTQVILLPRFRPAAGGPSSSTRSGALPSVPTS